MPLAAFLNNSAFVFQIYPFPEKIIKEAADNAAFSFEINVHLKRILGKLQKSMGK
jgi:hypothetical protein